MRNEINAKLELEEEQAGGLINEKEKEGYLILHQLQFFVVKFVDLLAY